MNKFLKYVWGAWCTITCFCSPVWLTLAVVNLTGLIYKYDYSMDEGTAGILGILLLVLWIVLALLPTLIFIKKNKKHIVSIVSIIVLLCLLCIGMCNWNMMEFLFLPRGM